MMFFDKGVILKSVLLGLIIFDGLRYRVAGVASIKPFLLIAMFFIVRGMFRLIYIPVHFRLFLLWYLTLLIPLVGMTVLSWSQFMTILFGHALLTAFYIAFYNFLLDRGWKLIDIYDSIIFLGVLSSFIALIQVVLFFGGLNLGVSHFHHIGVPRAESLFSETDWHAMFVGYCFLASLVIPSVSRFFLWRRWVVSFLALSLFLSFGRTAIAGALVCMMLYFLLFVPMRRWMTACLLLPLVAVPALFLIVAMAPDSIVNRFDVFSNLSDSSLDAGALDSRLFAIQMTIDYIQMEPFWGNGAGSVNYLATNEEIREIYAYGGGINNGRGGTNIFLTSMFDSGVLGLLFIVVFWVLIIRSYYSSSRLKRYNDDYFFKFMFLGVVYFLIECQANNMIRTPICWIHFSFFAYAFFLRRRKNILAVKCSRGF